MDITEVNDFLLQQATGRSKEEIQQDIEEIKRLTEEVSELRTQHTVLIKQVETATEQNTALRTENTELQNHNKALKEDNVRLDRENRHLAVTLPLLKAESEAYAEHLKEFKLKYDALEDRIKEAERIENQNNKKQQEIFESIQSEEEVKRYNVIQTKKVTDLMESNAYQVMQINLQQKPIHVHIRNIQDKLNKKNIKFDIIKELSVL